MVKNENTQTFSWSCKMQNILLSSQASFRTSESTVLQLFWRNTRQLQPQHWLLLYIPLSFRDNHPRQSFPLLTLTSTRSLFCTPFFCFLLWGMKFFSEARKDAWKIFSLYVATVNSTWSYMGKLECMVWWQHSTPPAPGYSYPRGAVICSPTSFWKH